MSNATPGWQPLNGLRFITCGSVNGGKSTLLGRMLRECKVPCADDRAIGEPNTDGSHPNEGNVPSLLDGLRTEDGQEMTIDLAYRFYQTQRRRLIVADTSGHEHHTRNMALSALTAELAVMLIEAREGVVTRIRHHTRIVALLGIRHVAVAVNKMDLVGWNPEVFENVRREYSEFAQSLNLTNLYFFPVSALAGDNVVKTSSESPWYAGPSLLDFLETVSIEHGVTAPFRLSVQSINGPNVGFRAFSGRITSGVIGRGDSVRIASSGRETTIRSIVTFDGDVNVAVAGQCVTLTLAEDVEVSRGDVISAAANPVETANQFEADMLWMSADPMLPARQYMVRIHHQRVAATITDIKHLVDVTTGAPLAAKSLAANQIGLVKLSLDHAVPFTPYASDRTLGGFLIIDRFTNETLGVGMIRYALRRSANIHWQAIDVNQDARAALKAQRPMCIWLTGLSGSGKTTIANTLDRTFHAAGLHTYVLDGDNVRHGLNRDLGFTAADRAENIRRVAEVARLMVDAGLIVIVSFISPYRSEREYARGLFRLGEFVEVFVDTPLAVCAERDPKGLYVKARAGKLPNFTGIDSPYEPPESAEVVVNTTICGPVEAAEQVARACNLIPTAN